MFQTWLGKDKICFKIQVLQDINFVIDFSFIIAERVILVVTLAVMEVHV